MSNQTEEINQFIKETKHPLKAEIEVVRAIILDADDQITEHIKWNAPSFCYEGEDRVTFNLHANDRILLVFHRGAKVKDSQGFVFDDPTGLLEWASKDRAMITLYDMKDVEAKKTALIDLVSRWMQATKS